VLGPELPDGGIERRVLPSQQLEGRTGQPEPVVDDRCGIDVDGQRSVWLQRRGGGIDGRGGAGFDADEGGCLPDRLQPRPLLDRAGRDDEIDAFDPGPVARPRRR
jgi:hypothetical protein